MDRQMERESAILDDCLTFLKKGHLKGTVIVRFVLW